MRRKEEHMWLKSFVLFIVFLLVTFLAIGNSYSEDDSVKLIDLIGLWKSDSDHYDIVLKFNTDGTFGIAYSVEKLDYRPIDRGKFKLEGQQVTFISSESPTCKSYTGKYGVKMIKKGNLQLTVEEDPCYDRRGFFVADWNRVKE